MILTADFFMAMRRFFEELLLGVEDAGAFTVVVLAHVGMPAFVERSYEKNSQSSKYEKPKQE